MLELTNQQIQAIEAQKPTPVQLINPATKEVYVLIRKEVYDLTRTIVGGAQGQVWDDEADDDLIAPQKTLREPA